MIIDDKEIIEKHKQTIKDIEKGLIAIIKKTEFYDTEKTNHINHKRNRRPETR